MNISFRNFNLDIFGSSHGDEIGVIIRGFPEGLVIDDDYVRKMMDRRRPGKSRLTTLRDESDQVIVRSGVINSCTDGNDIIGVIKNTNKRSGDYSSLKDTPRPSHADLTAFLKYKGKLDMTGGGPFSGRLTAPMVYAGSIAKKALEDKGIKIVSHIRSIGKISDEPLNQLVYDEKQLASFQSNKLPVINSDVSKRLIDYIDEVRNKLDSVGSTIETAVYDAPAGLGEHSDYSMEGMISRTVFCIPGVKGIEFGKGFELSKMNGSKANDEIYYDSDMKIKTKTNHSGGILGGISNGMPITFTIAMKPTPSIAKKQQTINFATKENVAIEVVGRHDPCIGIRAVPVVEAMCALVIFDYLLENDKHE
ncbi:MAG: chorismate synthase [Clostridia bacterium]|nr:chorismate synthase [Clostridia bacterium]